MHRTLADRFLPLARLCAVGLLALGALGAQAVTDADDESGELIGDLMFHADLMSTLDSLCPVRAPMRDWQAVLHTLPARAREPELRDLSRRLSTDAAQSMVRASGGCGTRHYARVYAQMRNEYESLLEQWAQLSV
jgi:hypothetical protein